MMDGWMNRWDGWTHTRDLCNHDNIYTDTYVHQCIIPRRVITIYTRGENSAKSKAFARVYACAGACGRVCAHVGNYEQIMNKL